MPEVSQTASFKESSLRKFIIVHYTKNFYIECLPIDFQPAISQLVEKYIK